MAKKISRRNLLAGTVTAGLAAGSLPKAAAQAPQRPKETKLPDVGGEDFLYQDVKFYGIHCTDNIIAPDPEADRCQRHIFEAVNSADETGCQLILTLGR